MPPRTASCGGCLSFGATALNVGKGRRVTARPRDGNGMQGAVELAVAEAVERDVRDRLQLPRDLSPIGAWQARTFQIAAKVPVRFLVSRGLARRDSGCFR